MKFNQKIIMMEYDYDYDEQEYNYSVDPSYEGEGTTSELGLKRNESYCIIQDKDVERIRDKTIEEAKDFTSLSRDEAILALTFFKWNMEKLQERWCEDPENVLIDTGISQSLKSKSLLTKAGIKGNNEECLICYSSKDDCSDFFALKCNHFFCGDCWKEHLKVHAFDYNTVLNTLCPQQDCNLLVPESAFYKYISDDEMSMKNYIHGMHKNFTDHNIEIKWCPSSGCDACVKCDSKSNKEIDCICGYTFCFKCGKEGHRPCQCDMVNVWDKKNQSESENVKWLQANTKQCPKCKKYIEKNQGCDHMTCRTTAGGCGHEFCWICFGDWKGHSSCNKFAVEESKKAENDRKNIKLELEKYVHYFTRYSNHAKAHILAMKQKNAIEYNIHLFNSLKNVPFPDLVFLRDATDSIIRSRRLLKYSYVFGYYLMNKKEKDLFEHIQSLLEKNVNRLHELLENETMTNIMALNDFEDFNHEFTNFRNSIIDLYSATNKFVTNLLSSIENGMLHLVDYSKMKEG